MKNKEIRKNQIIKDSIDIMYLNGYNGTSVKEIATAAGIPKGSFYNYFSGKEQYAVEAVHFYYKTLEEERFAFLMNKDIAPQERIFDFFKQGLESLEKVDLKYGCFAGNLTEEMGDVSESISIAVATFYNDLIDKIYETLIQINELTGQNSKEELKILAGFIISSWQGCVLRMKAMKNHDALEEFMYVLEHRLLK